MVGAAAGAAVAHHRGKNQAEEQYDEQPQYAAAPAPAPAPATATDQLEHLAELHSSGALSDEEFASAKAKVLGT